MIFLILKKMAVMPYHLIPNQEYIRDFFENSSEQMHEIPCYIEEVSNVFIISLLSKLYRVPTIWQRLLYFMG